MSGSQITTYRPAWASYWKAWLSLAALISISLIVARVRPEPSDVPAWLHYAPLLLGLAPALLILVSLLFHRYTHAYQIESGRRLRTTIGFIARNRREFLISDKIQTDLNQTFLGRLLGYGTLRFWTGDDQSGQAWVNVASPNRLEAEIKTLAMKGVSVSPASAKNKTNQKDTQTSTTNSPVGAQSLRSHVPSGTVFAKHAVILPSFPLSLTRHVGSLDPVTESQQYVSKGDPLLKLTLMTKDATLLGEGKFVDIFIRTPVSGLVLRRSHFARLTDEDKSPVDAMRTTILPVRDERVEAAEFIYGPLCDAVWSHRDFLFRQQKKLKEISNYNAASADWVVKWTRDSTIREALDVLRSTPCDIVPARPGFDDYISEAWIQRSHLRDLLNPFVDTETLRKVNKGYSLVDEDVVDQAIRMHEDTLRKLADND